MVRQAKRFVVVEWGEIFLVSAYISPNSDRSDFLTFLDELGTEIHSLGRRVLVCGDFNSKSTYWGSRKTDTRGSLVEEWAAECDLRLLNVIAKANLYKASRLVDNRPDVGNPGPMRKNSRLEGEG